jgi:hypothetical protein
MTIDRIFVALRRSTHLRISQIQSQYPELYALLLEAAREREQWKRLINGAHRRWEILGWCWLSDRDRVSCRLPTNPAATTAQPAPGQPLP